MLAQIGSPIAPPTMAAGTRTGDAAMYTRMWLQDPLALALHHQQNRVWHREQVMLGQPPFFWIGVWQPGHLWVFHHSQKCIPILDPNVSVIPESAHFSPVCAVPWRKQYWYPHAQVMSGLLLSPVVHAEHWGQQTELGSFWRTRKRRSFSHTSGSTDSMMVESGNSDVHDGSAQRRVVRPSEMLCVK